MDFLRRKVGHDIAAAILSYVDLDIEILRLDVEYSIYCKILTLDIYETLYYADNLHIKVGHNHMDDVDNKGKRKCTDEVVWVIVSGGATFKSHYCGRDHCCQYRAIWEKIDLCKDIRKKCQQ